MPGKKPIREVTPETARKIQEDKEKRKSEKALEAQRQLEYMEEFKAQPLQDRGPVKDDEEYQNSKRKFYNKRRIAVETEEKRQERLDQYKARHKEKSQDPEYAAHRSSETAQYYQKQAALAEAKIEEGKAKFMAGKEMVSYLHQEMAKAPKIVQGTFRREIRTNQSIEDMMRDNPLLSYDEAVEAERKRRHRGERQEERNAAQHSAQSSDPSRRDYGPFDPPAHVKTAWDRELERTTPEMVTTSGRKSKRKTNVDRAGAQAGKTFAQTTQGFGDLSISAPTAQDLWGPSFDEAQVAAHLAERDQPYAESAPSKPKKPDDDSLSTISQNWDKFAPGLLEYCGVDPETCEQWEQYWQSQHPRSRSPTPQTHRSLPQQPQQRPPARGAPRTQEEFDEADAQRQRPKRTNKQRAVEKTADREDRPDPKRRR